LGREAASNPKIREAEANPESRLSGGLQGAS